MSGGRKRQILYLPGGKPRTIFAMTFSRTQQAKQARVSLGPRVDGAKHTGGCEGNLGAQSAERGESRPSWLLRRPFIVQTDISPWAQHETPGGLTPAGRWNWKLKLALSWTQSRQPSQHDLNARPRMQTAFGKTEDATLASATGYRPMAPRKVPGRGDRRRGQLWSGSSAATILSTRYQLSAHSRYPAGPTV